MDNECCARPSAASRLGLSDVSCSHSAGYTSFQVSEGVPCTGFPLLRPGSGTTGVRLGRAPSCSASNASTATVRNYMKILITSAYSVWCPHLLVCLGHGIVLQALQEHGRTGKAVGARSPVFAFRDGPGAFLGSAQGLPCLDIVHLVMRYLVRIVTSPAESAPIHLKVLACALQALAKYAFGLGSLTMFASTVVFTLMSLPPGKGIGTQILVKVSAPGAMAQGLICACTLICLTLQSSIYLFWRLR